MTKRNEEFTVVWNNPDEDQTIVDWTHAPDWETAIKCVSHNRGVTPDELGDAVVFPGHLYALNP